MSSEDTEAGSQYDNYAKQFIFVRPKRYEKDDLILLFHDDEREFSPVNVGTENVFALSNALTQTQSLRVQTVFKRDGTIIIHSNILIFSLSRSLFSGNAPVEVWPNPLEELSASAFCKASYDGGVLSFCSLTEAPLQQLNITEEACVGLVTTTTLPAGNSAHVDIRPAGRAFDFHFDIPQGLPGKTGETGAKGEPGNNADIGVHNSDLSAHKDILTEKANKDGTLQANLNTEMHNGWKRLESLAQLGIATGEETMERICAAMPDRSILFWGKATNNPAAVDLSAGYPINSGNLQIIRLAAYRTDLSFAWMGAGGRCRKWEASYASNISPSFSGWKEVAFTESGTWTPIFADTSGNSPIYTSSGRYHKNGNTVKIFGQISLSARNTSMGTNRVSGLPFAISGLTPPPIGMLHCDYVTSTLTGASFFVRGSSSGLMMSAQAPGTAYQIIAGAHMANNSVFVFEIEYSIA